MRKLIICLTAILLSFYSYGKEIIKGEYFFNSEPGIGMGTAIDISSPDSIINLDFLIDIPDSLPNGFNTIYFRFMDDSSRWSHVYPRIFIKESAESVDSAISYIEYFIDDDPGEGLATSVPVSNASAKVSVDFNVSLEGLETGFHKLYIRARNKQGNWGITSRRVFFIDPNSNSQLVNIVGIKYYFKNETFESDTFDVAVETPQPTVNLNFKADISSLPPNQEYTMFIIAINEEGAKSTIATRTIKACSTPPPIANFDYISVGNRVSFIDSSQFSEHYYWDFGDGKTDTVTNPVHQFSEFGIHEVQMISSNFCKSDTVITKVLLSGLNSINTELGSNIGTLTLNITGGGFSNSTNIFLQSNDNIIIPDTIIVSNPNEAKLLLDLHDQNIGDYDVILSNNNITDTLKAAFKVIENNDEVIPYIDIIGRNVIRTGRPNDYLVKIGNDGMNDSYGTPILIILEGDSTVDVKFDFDIDSVDFDDFSMEDIYFSPDSIYGRNFSGKIFPFYIPFIPASSSVEFNMKITSNSNINIQYWVNQSFYNSPLNPTVSECVFNSIDHALGILPGYSCGRSVIDEAFNVFEVWKYRIYDSKKTKVNSTIGHLGSVFKTCLSDFTFNKSKENIYNVTYLLYGLHNKEILQKEKDKYSYLIDCYEAFSNRFQKTKEISVVNSFDPNEKVGPSNITPGNYVKGLNTFNYSVYFENVDSATAAAQEVFITDTLDKSVLDISTFSLGEMAFGDTVVVTPPPGLKAYSDLVDLRPNLNLIVRIDAKLDTATGIVRWHYMSLDPATMELTDDPILGFLPPNRNPKEGEGHVSYSVKPKTGLSHGTVIKNKAEIIFDLNEPIITNEHINTIDILEPVSSIQPLNTTQADTSFVVDWSGTDPDAGIRAYDVYVSTNNGPFELWQYDVDYTQAVFHGRNDSTYGFYSLSKDYAGNIEFTKDYPEASTIINATTSVKTETFSEHHVSVYPNPSQCCFTISFDVQQPVAYTLHVFNVTGTKILSRVVTQNDYQLDLSEFPKGIYGLTILYENSVITKQLILE